MSQDKYSDSSLFNLMSVNNVTGESSYDIWKSLGYGETREEFINFLKQIPVDNLLSDSATDPLSANQGRILKALIDELKEEPVFENDVTIEGEIKANNVPYTVSETILCTIPAATIQELLDNGTKSLTLDTFEFDPTVIAYATYGGLEYSSIYISDSYFEFFISNPSVNEGFACSITMGTDADGNEDSTKAKFNYRVLDTENVTDLVIYQMVISTIDSKYFEHDFNIIHSFSMNRRGAIGDYSAVFGSSCKATANSAFACGLACEATADDAFACGKGSYATAEAAASFGLMTTASARYASARGRYSKATAQGANADGNSTTASGQYSHAEGVGSVSKATGSHAEGNYTIAGSAYQHVEGKYNVEDTASKYAHIVGNGTSTSNRSNAYALDWEGNAYYAGSGEYDSIILRSSTEGSTKKFKITIDDSGTLTTTEIV